MTPLRILNYPSFDVNCRYFERGSCYKGLSCPYKHTANPNANNQWLHNIQYHLHQQQQTIDALTQKLKEISEILPHCMDINDNLIGMDRVPRHGINRHTAISNRTSLMETASPPHIPHNISVPSTSSDSKQLQQILQQLKPPQQHTKYVPKPRKTRSKRCNRSSSSDDDDNWMSSTVAAASCDSKRHCECKEPQRSALSAVQHPAVSQPQQTPQTNPSKQKKQNTSPQNKGKKKTKTKTKTKTNYLAGAFGSLYAAPSTHKMKKKKKTYPPPQIPSIDKNMKCKDNANQLEPRLASSDSYPPPNARPHRKKKKQQSRRQLPPRHEVDITPRTTAVMTANGYEMDIKQLINSDTDEHLVLIIKEYAVWCTSLRITNQQ
eukprot:624405_1